MLNKKKVVWMSIETHLLDDPMWMILLFAVHKKKKEYLKEESFSASFVPNTSRCCRRAMCFCNRTVVFFSLYLSFQSFFCCVLKAVLYFLNLQVSSESQNIFHFFLRLTRIVYRSANYIHFFFSHVAPHCNIIFFSIYSFITLVVISKTTAFYHHDNWYES